MRIVDDAILARLQAVDELNVFDGYVPTDDTGKVVTFPLPFVVFYSALGIESKLRLSGRRGQRTVGFMVTFVGRDRNQAKWAGEKARGALVGHRLDIPGRKVGLIDLLTSPWVWRDDDMLQPSGEPVFYGRDTYEVPIINVPSI